MATKPLFDMSKAKPIGQPMFDMSKAKTIGAAQTPPAATGGVGQPVANDDKGILAALARVGTGFASIPGAFMADSDEQLQKQRANKEATDPSAQFLRHFFASQKEQLNKAAEYDKMPDLPKDASIMDKLFRDPRHQANAHRIGGYIPIFGPLAADIEDRLTMGRDPSGAITELAGFSEGPRLAGKGLKGLGTLKEVPGMLGRARDAYEELASKHNDRPVDSPLVQRAFAKAKKAMEQEGKEGFEIPKPIKDFVAHMEDIGKPGLTSAGEPNAFVERPAATAPTYRAVRNFITSLGSAIEWDKPAGGKGGAVDRIAKSLRQDLKSATHETLEPHGDKEKALKADKDFETSLKWLRRLKLGGGLTGKLLGYGTGHPFAGAALGTKLGTAGGEAFGERLMKGPEKAATPERLDAKSAGVNSPRDTGSMARAKSELPPNAPLSQVVARALEINQEFNDPTRRYKGPSKTLEMSKVNEGIHRNLQARIENAKTAGEKFVAVQKLRAFEAKMGGFEVTDPRGNEALQNIINRNENKPR